MAKLIYSAISSLDGYVADERDNFDWAAPDEEVHAFVNDLERRVGTYLYGRRMYEMMRYWETAPGGGDELPVRNGYAEVWRAGGRQDRVLEDAGDGNHLEDADRARLRPWSCWPHEGASAARYLGGRSRPRCPGDQRWAGRRAPSVPRPDRGGRRQTVPPTRSPCEARTAGRTALRLRRGSPPLPPRWN